MSANLLRRAAAMLREHAAGCVINGPWEYRDQGDDPDVFPWAVYAPESKYTAGTGFAPGTASYIALMHPPVALALAELLDAEAALMVATSAAGGHRVEAARALAQAILRGGA